MTYYITLDLSYNNTDLNRKLVIPDVAEADAALATVRNKVQAINDSLAGGTDDGLSTFFRADDGSLLNKISAFTVSSEEVTTLI